MNQDSKVLRQPLMFIECETQRVCPKMWSVILQIFQNVNTFWVSIKLFSGKQKFKKNYIKYFFFHFVPHVIQNKKK